MRPSFFSNIEIKMISCFRCGLILSCCNPGFWKTELARIQTLARHKVLGLIWLENLIILKIIGKKIHLMCNWDLKIPCVYIRLWFSDSNPFYFIQVSHFTINIYRSQWIKEIAFQWINEKAIQWILATKLHSECTNFIIKTAQGIRARCFGFSAGMLLFWLKNLFITK